MQCPSCHLVMAQCHEDKQNFYFLCKRNTCFDAGIQCKYCNLIKLSKKGCIKITKYIMLKHFKQEHLLFHNPVSCAQVCTFNNDISDIISHKLSSYIVNATESISTISSSSYLNKINSVALPSSNVGTQAINYLFLEFKHFDSQSNQLNFFSTYYVHYMVVYVA